MARSDSAYLLFHRGITHSLLGLAVLPPLLAAALWWGLGRRTPLRWLLAACWLGTSLHVLYDLLTSWGTLLLYPFSLDRFALDWINIVDPMTWLAPIAALVVARRRPDLSRAAALGFLAAVAAWALAAGALHRSVVTSVAKAEQGAGRPVAEAFAFPRLGAPFHWRGLAVGPPGPEGGPASGQITRYPVSGILPALGAPERIERGFDDPWVARALATPAGQAYLWWAEVPVASVDSTGDAARGEITVTLADLRYTRTLAPAAEVWTPLALRITFDPETGEVRDVRW